MHEDWVPYFAAQAGAAGALAGLVFVALSINLSSILTDRSLVDRAAEALTLLVGPVLVGLAALVPASTLPSLGFAAALPAVGCWVIVTILLRRGMSSSYQRPPWQVALRLAQGELATLPAVIGAGLLIADCSAGFALLALSGIVAIAVGILDAWVLLVEIKR